MKKRKFGFVIIGVLAVLGYLILKQYHLLKLSSVEMRLVQLNDICEYATSGFVVGALNNPVGKLVDKYC